MADTKVSAMTNASALAGGEEFHVVQSTNDRAASIDQVKTYVTTTPLAVVGNATAGAELRLPEDTDNGSNYVAIKAPDSLSATYTLTLPADDGSADQYLKTDGSGGLSWATVSGASAPLTLASGTITDPSAALTITQTWNDAADTFIGMDMTVTNTNSAAASRLLRLKYGAAASETSRFEVNPAGAINLSNGTSTVTLRQLTLYGTNYISTTAVGASTYYPIQASNFVGGVKWGTGDTDIDVTFSAGIDGIRAQSNITFAWCDSAANIYNVDTLLNRVGAGVVGVRGATTSAGAALNFLEQTAPSAPSANQVVVYAEDNGSGKTRLMARFATGAAQVLATEP